MLSENEMKRTIIDLRNRNAELLEALIQSKRMIDEALPKFNWAASVLDGDAIRLLNETPGIVSAAIAKATQE